MILKDTIKMSTLKDLYLPPQNLPIKVGKLIALFITL